MSKGREESIISNINIDKERCIASGSITISGSDLELISLNVMKSTRGKSHSYQQYQFDLMIDSFIREKAISSKAFGEILEWKGEPRIRISRNRDVAIGQRMQLVCHVECDTFPELPELDFPVNFQNPEITIIENDIEKEIEKILYQNRVEVEKDGLIEEGDVIKFIFEFIYEEGSQIDDEEKTFVVGPMMEKKMLEKLLKAKAGDVVEQEIVVPTPEELKNNPYRDELLSIAGQKTKGKIHINKVMKLVNPSIDELLKKLNFETEDKFRERVKDSIKNHIDNEVQEFKIAQVSAFLRGYDFPVSSTFIEESTGSVMRNAFSTLGLKYDELVYTNSKFQNDFMEILSSKNDLYKGKTFEDFMKVVNIFSKKEVVSNFMISKLRGFLGTPENEIKNAAIKYLIESNPSEAKNLEYFTSNIGAAQKYVMMEMCFEKLKAEGKTISHPYSSVEEFNKMLTDFTKLHNVVHFVPSN